MEEDAQGQGLVGTSPYIDYDTLQIIRQRLQMVREREVAGTKEAVDRLQAAEDPVALAAAVEHAFRAQKFLFRDLRIVKSWSSWVWLPPKNRK